MDRQSLRDLARKKGGDKAPLEEAAQMARQYQNRTPQQIEQELHRMLGRKEVQNMIRSGKLAEFAKTVQPLLDEKQRQKLRTLLDSLQEKP